MEWTIPDDIRQFVAELDAFIDREIAPLEAAHPEFFDHRREFARTDWERDGFPKKEWRELLLEARRRSDAAGFFRFPLPKELGGQAGSNLAMAIVREHLLTRGSGLHFPHSDEASVVANLPLALVLHELCTNAAKYGSLASEKGRVDIRWTRSEKGVDLTWTESGGEKVVTPLGAGFGTRLISEILAVELGTVEFEPHPDGVRCRIHINM